jgi:uncharacterized small protein (DUF1192 family)
MAVMVSASTGLVMGGILKLAFEGAQGSDSPLLGGRKGGPAVDEPAEVRVGRGQRLLEAVREDLELFGVAELEERLEVLRAEVERVNAQIHKKQSGRAAADALFAPRSN